MKETWGWQEYQQEYPHQCVNINTWMYNPDCTMPCGSNHTGGKNITNAIISLLFPSPFASQLVVLWEDGALQL